MNEKLFPGKKFDFGTFSLSEQEIIDFARQFDPLPFHLDIELARKTIFKGLVASGPHPFNYIYKREWVPRFGKTVICGKGVSDWKFIRPVYANQKIAAELTALVMEPDEKTRGIIISWLFAFSNEKGEPVQVLQMDVIHKFPISDS